MDLSGQCIGRYYHLIAPLSTGATSAVYHAAHTEHGGEFAVKCIPKIGLTPKQLLRRISEVFHHQLVSDCSPHILPLYEIVDEDAYLFLVFKLCDIDLHQAIWSCRLYQRNDALIRETFLDIVEGVYACHTKGVFHRDLKPLNILCKDDGSGIQIADFGLATRKRICRGSRCGTPDYMSPEQWTIDATVYFPSLADIWSLGIILLNMVTGRCPWRFAHQSDDAFRAFLEEEDYLYYTYPISQSLNRVLKWILSPNPMDRPQILQIQQAILNVDTFYRTPRPTNYSSAAWSRRMALIQNGYSSDSTDCDASPDVKTRGLVYGGEC